tara:strand:- start:168 stop:812 length:645 start_codon:yes stop_codon:yes gene_type:complete
MDEGQIQLIKPFGPSIVKAKIPIKIVDSLNSYIDEIVANEKKSLHLDHGRNLVGDVTQEFKLEKEIMETSGWSKFLASCVSKWVEIEMKSKITKFKMIDSWVVRQFENEYNPTHWHSGHISGAGFLKVPKNLGKHVQTKENQTYKGGILELIHGSRMFSSQSVMSIKPEVGLFYFFPNYLMHAVFPFKGTDEERRSISFNANIDDDIYNVYGKQ